MVAQLLSLLNKAQKKPTMKETALISGEISSIQEISDPHYVQAEIRQRDAWQCPIHVMTQHRVA